GGGGRGRTGGRAPEGVDPPREPARRRRRRERRRGCAGFVEPPGEPARRRGGRRGPAGLAEVLVVAPERLEEALQLLRVLLPGLALDARADVEGGRLDGLDRHDHVPAGDPAGEDDGPLELLRRLRERPVRELARAAVGALLEG